MNLDKQPRDDLNINWYMHNTNWWVQSYIAERDLLTHGIYTTDPIRLDIRIAVLNILREMTEHEFR